MDAYIVSISRFIHQYKVSSGTAPFADSSPTSVATKIMMGQRPERPKDPILTDGLWVLTQRCLEENPQSRPEITEVISYLRILAGRRDYADVAMVDDTTREGELVSRRSPLINSFEISQDYSVHSYQHWWRCELETTPPEYRPASDGAHSVKPSEFWHIVNRVESGESDTHEGM